MIAITKKLHYLDKRFHQILAKPFNYIKHCTFYATKNYFTNLLKSNIIPTFVNYLPKEKL